MLEINIGKITLLFFEKIELELKREIDIIYIQRKQHAKER